VADAQLERVHLRSIWQTRYQMTRALEVLERLDCAVAPRGSFASECGVARGLDEHLPLVEVQG
jgi:hypothetical protein